MISMRKWYYQMWSEGIYSLQKKKEKDPTMLPWKVGSLTIVSFANCFNLITILFWLKQAGFLTGVFINVHVSEISAVNSFLSFSVWLLPFYILNYFMFIFNNKHERIIREYPPKNEKGWAMILYFIISFVLLLAPIFIVSKVLNV